MVNGTFDELSLNVSLQCPEYANPAFLFYMSNPDVENEDRLTQQTFWVYPPAVESPRRGPSAAHFAPSKGGRRTSKYRQMRTKRLE